MNSTDSSGLGTLSVSTSWLSLPNIPSIFYEWAAILPLAIYLANPEQTHQLIGKASLSDRIQTAPFPKLGVLAHIARLLHEGPDFMDRVNSIGGLRNEIWDANWGSVFPCANGSASRIIAAFALRNSETITIPETILEEDTSESRRSSFETLTKDSGGCSGHVTTKESATLSGSGSKLGFRRYQTLHVLRFNRERNARHPSDMQTAQTVLGLVFEFTLMLALLVAAVVSLLFGLYGTAVCLLVGILVRISCQLIVLQRTELYLHDNEEGKIDGCMLGALHQNASTWYLYTGDRGIIDGMLNKPMISGVLPGFGKSVPSAVFVYFIQLLSMLQLAAVTYVAAQKGWDSVGLFSFILISMLLDTLWGRQTGLARDWLQRHRIAIEARTFLFSGRVIMVGAIQAFKQNDVTSWMDGILQCNPRRDAFLTGLSGPGVKYRAMLAALDEGERKGVERNVALSRQAAQLMQKKFTVV
ncbi:hypothetical protein BJX76DRAFT_357121 [Aspergillus varians]